MNIIQIYLQGAKHKAKQQPCEDRTYSLSKNGVSVIALADGAGSSKYTHSAQGAECVTKTIARFFCNNFDKFYNKEDVEELSKVVMTVCQKALQKEADRLKVDEIYRMSSTLLCVAVKKEKSIICHIGDGVIGKLTFNGTKVVSAPDNGEFASTTYFITNPLANEHIKILKGTTGGVVSYFLMSDGTAEYVYDEYNNRFLDAARKMALMPFESNGQEKLEQTVSEFMIKKDMNSDDCSFACMLLDKDKSFEQESSVTTSNVNLPYEKYPYYEEQTMDNMGISKEDDNNKQTSKQFKINKLLIIVVFVVFVLVFTITTMFSNCKDKKDKTETTKTHTTIITEKTSESFKSEEKTNVLKVEDTK